MQPTTNGWRPLIGLGLATCVLSGVALAHASPRERLRRSPVHRKPVLVDRSTHGMRATARSSRYPLAFRTIDGRMNNLVEIDWGSAAINLLRTSTVDYAGDGTGKLAGPDRRSPREISNIVQDQGDSLIPNPLGASDYLWQWGQFLDHDIVETPTGDEERPIPVPLGDPVFDRDGLGDVEMGFHRSAYTEVDGIRQQLNNITSYIDASNVYGSDDDRAKVLRAKDGSGRLAMSDGDLLPPHIEGYHNAMLAHQDPTTFYLAGDFRANEQIGLTAMHTLFIREHNYWADRFRAEDPTLAGDAIYERARAMVAAEIQAISYREFLPLLLGPGAIPSYAGYRANMDASISNVFATAAYRVGHTMLSPTLLRLDAEGNEIAAGHISLANSFFSPDEIREHGIDPILRGLAAQAAQNIDVYIVDAVRNFLFGPSGTGFDLASLNIQRGRDHGLPSYNQVRIDFGLAPKADFANITSDPVVSANLATAYATVDDIDAWVGMLAEPHAPGALVGETLVAVLADQFVRLRDGDRFWYESYLPPRMAALVERQTLARIIRRNTSIGSELQANVFMVTPSPCLADIQGDGAVGFEDLIEVLQSWGPCASCAADLDRDDVVGFGDLVLVLNAWGTCP